MDTEGSPPDGEEDSLKDLIWLLNGGDVFPYAAGSATRDRVDFDHSTPYVRDGSPGQTGTHNSGPLRRRHHQWKTHGGFRCRQAGPGRHIWQAPSGDCYIVDHTGTHRVRPDHAEMILTAGGTESINLALKGLFWARRRAGVAVGSVYCMAASPSAMTCRPTRRSTLITNGAFKLSVISPLWQPTMARTSASARLFKESGARSRRETRN